MKTIQTIVLIGSILLLGLTGCSGNNKKPQKMDQFKITEPISQDLSTNKPKLVGGRCEGCEAVFEFGDKILSSVDTLPVFNEQGLKIKVKGTIYLNDGNTPAKDVILYVYHTDQKGLYSTKDSETGWGKRHGYNRGWVKTDNSGKYEFYTLKPGVYPNRSAPAHIHPIILEPNGKYYWHEDYHFEGDSLLTERETNPNSPRGGDSGLLSLKEEGDIWVGTKDIVLGKNVPNYD
jgi:protocatechuate 3,4-dioxygenase beta subunit